MSRFVQLDYYSDPGHGWYRVQREELQRYGVAALISSCSYERGRYVYLEEDQDATIFTRAVEAEGDSVEIVGNITTNEDSFIRSMNRFAA